METKQLEFVLQKLNEVKDEVKIQKIEIKKKFDQIESILSRIESQFITQKERLEDTPIMIRKRARVVFPEVGMSNQTKRIMSQKVNK